MIENSDIDTKVVWVLRLVDESERFDVEEVLKLFEGLDAPSLRRANKQISSVLRHRSTIRNRESRRLNDLTTGLFTLTFDEIQRQRQKQK